jgi:hypothetical protein
MTTEPIKPKATTRDYEIDGRKLPVFLVADDGGDRDFVLHLRLPMFVLEIGHDKPWWVNPPGSPEDAGRLVKEAATFFMTVMARVKGQGDN